MGVCHLRLGGVIVLAALACCSPAAAAETKLVGSSSLESQTDSESAGRAEAFSQTAIASGTAETAYVYIGSSNAAKTIVVGIYSNASSHPGTLLATGSAKATAAGTWAAVPITHVALASGAAYWLAIMGEGGTLHYRDHPFGTCRSEESAQSGLTALPASWKTGTSFKDCPASVYVTSGATPPPPPTTLAPPGVTGLPVEGQSLTGSTGTWSGAPTSYAYQWQDCNALGEGCLNIGGATGSTYKLTAGDVGATARLVVKATNAGGSGEAASLPTALVTAAPPPPPPPANTVLPALSGSAVEGQSLSGSTGTWSGAPTSYAYQWLACNAAGEGCAEVTGAKSSSFALTSANVGGTVRLSVTATNATGSTTATSASSAVVTAAPPPPPPAIIAPPVITGTPVEGQSLTGSTGTWSGAPTSYAYRWQDCNTLGEACVNAGGATGSAYKLTAADVGATVRLVVSATNGGGTVEAASLPTQVITAAPPPPPPPANTAPPALSGSPVEGQSLSGSTGTWSGAPTSYAYQWLDCNASGEACVEAAGATAASFKLTSANVGGTVRLSVKATNNSGSTTATSASSAVVTAAPPPVGEPALLLGVKVPHNNGGDAKEEEVTPLKFTALKSGTVETLYFEAGGYKYAPSETSLILGIQESVGGLPGKVLGQGTINATLGLNAIGKVGGLSVPVTAGTTYYLTFLPLGGSITYWYSKAETVIYSEHHKSLEEGIPPEKWLWKEEAQEAPIGMWAEGTTH